jgi:hypothetical protein
MESRIRLLALVLTALLLATVTAYAAGPVPGPATASAEEEFEVIEEVEEEDPARECAEAREEFARGEIEREEVELFCEEAEAESWEAGGSASQSSQCPLRSAHAHAATHRHTLKVTLAYTAYEPFKARLHLSHHLGSLKRQLGRSGVLRFTRRLGQKHLNKLVLKLRPTGTAGCPAPRLVLFPG